MKSKHMISVAVAMMFFASCSSKKDGSGASGIGVSGSASSESHSSSSVGALEYEFISRSTGCTTQRQIFGSTESFCRGLQNNTLNKNCALAERQEVFRQRCPGPFIPFYEQGQGEIPRNPEGSLDPAKVSYLALGMNETSEEISQFDPQVSERVMISCVNTVSAALNDSSHGIMLLASSQIVLKRDKALESTDGSSSGDLAPAALISCARGERRYLDSLHMVSTISLNTGWNTNRIRASVVVSSVDDETKTVRTTISCWRSISQALRSKDGIALTSGSSILVKRWEHGAWPYAIYHCN